LGKQRSTKATLQLHPEEPRHDTHRTERGHRHRPSVAFRYARAGVSVRCGVAMVGCAGTVEIGGGTRQLRRGRGPDRARGRVRRRTNVRSSIGRPELTFNVRTRCTLGPARDPGGTGARPRPRPRRPGRAHAVAVWWPSKLASSSRGRGWLPVEAGSRVKRAVHARRHTATCTHGPALPLCDAHIDLAALVVAFACIGIQQSSMHRARVGASPITLRAACKCARCLPGRPGDRIGTGAPTDPGPGSVKPPGLRLPASMPIPYITCICCHTTRLQLHHAPWYAQMPTTVDAICKYKGLIPNPISKAYQSI
jgi:hypothetical protein